FHVTGVQTCALPIYIIRKYGGLFICDEVQTGFGRTGGKMWGIEHHEGVEPDIMTMAKGIANGLPIGACLATVPVADAWTAGNIEIGRAAGRERGESG